MDPFGAHFGAQNGVLRGDHFSTIFGVAPEPPSGPILASFWLLPGLSWAHLGPNLAPLGLILAPFWPHLGPLGLSWRPLGPVLALLAALGLILALLASYFLQRPTSLCSFYVPALGFISWNHVVSVPSLDPDLHSEMVVQFNIARSV